MIGVLSRREEPKIGLNRDLRSQKRKPTPFAMVCAVSPE
jgi:hypothetical protein